MIYFCNKITDLAGPTKIPSIQNLEKSFDDHLCFWTSDASMSELSFKQFYFYCINLHLCSSTNNVLMSNCLSTKNTSLS